MNEKWEYEKNGLELEEHAQSALQQQVGVHSLVLVVLHAVVAFLVVISTRGIHCTMQ